MSEETETLRTINYHIRLVQKYLTALSRQLTERAVTHDISKLSEGEFAGFVQINRIAREHPYGSEEYRSSLRAVEPNPIDLHYSRNSHHPEHYENGFNDMGLIDIIEMVCDWKSASEAYGQTSFSESIKISAERFKLNEAQLYLVLLIANEIEGV